jgi:hypothetical protein
MTIRSRPGLLDADGDMIWRYRDPIGFRITKDS